MGKVKMEWKRTIIAVLTLALVCMFMLPVQAFAEDGIDGSTVVQETNIEGGSGESSVAAEVVLPEASGSSPELADAPAAPAAPVPSESVVTESTQTVVPESTETESTVTESTETGATETESTQTESTVTESAESETTETETTESETTETESTEGETAESEATETETTEPESTETESAETESTVEEPSEEAPVTSLSVETQVAADTVGTAAPATADNSGGNAIQQAVNAAIAAGQKYITIVVQDGTYTGGLVIDNSGTDANGKEKESIVVNIIAHDAYTPSDAQGATEPVIVGSSSSASNPVYAVPTNSDGTPAVNSGSAGGVKLEGGVSVKNVELLLAGIYLTLKEQKENQGKLESMFGDKGNVDVSVENADNFTYYGTSKGDTANITLKDVANTKMDTGEGDDAIVISTTTSGNVQLDTTIKDDTALKNQFDAAASANSSISISSGSGNDKITVTETSSVTNEGKVVSVRKGQNTLKVNAGDGADTITLKGSTTLVDIKKNIDEATAKRVYAIVCRDITGHGSSATIEGGAGDDQLNLDTTWELGTLGKTKVDYRGGNGDNRLHLTGTLAEKDGRVIGELNAQTRNGYISLCSSNTASRTDYVKLGKVQLSKTVTDLTVKSAIAMYIQMQGVNNLTDDLAGKKTVNVTIEGGKVMAEGKEVSFLPFTDYVYDPEGDAVNLSSFTNTSAGGLLSKVIIRGQNLTVGSDVAIRLPGATLMLESVNGTESGGTILIEGYLEADNIMLKLLSSDSHAISFVEQEGDAPSVLDVNTSASVTIAPTAKLVATRMVDVLAKSVQSNGLLPDLTELVPGLESLTESEKTKKLNEYAKKLFGVDNLEALEQAASINFISIKIASAVIEILGQIIAGAVRVVASNQVDTTAANSALRDLGLPFALSVIVSEAGIKVSDGASVTANMGDIYLDAQSDVKVNTTAMSGRLPFTLAVSVVDNKAYVDISGGKLISTNGNIIANASGIVNLKTSATGSNVRPNNNAVVPSTDNQASNTTTHMEMGKSGGFFAISILNQDVFAALKGAAEAIAKGNITVTSTAKATVVNNAASNPGEDGESMTLVKLLKILAGDDSVETDGGLVGKITKAINGHYEGKKDQTSSQEEKAELEKKKEKRTSALGKFLDKLTGNGEDAKGDDVGSLIDKATSSANSGQKDSTHTVQLLGALAVTYTSNNNKAYIETTGEVKADGKLGTIANGELNVQTLADGSPVKADDPAAGDKKPGPKDQHYNAHSHGVVKVDALTNGTIIIDASIGQNEDGTYLVEENDNFPKGIDAFEDFHLVVKACFGYKLQADENGKYWITNEYVRDSDKKKVTDKIEVILVGKDADGCYLYKSANNSGYGGVRVYNGENLFKAEFKPKQSITVNSNDALGTVEITDAQADGRKVYFADYEEVVHIKVNIKSGVTFVEPYITYPLEGSTTLQPVDILKITEDVEEDGTKTYYYSFIMPKGNVTINIPLTGDGMNIKLDAPVTGSKVWITPADQEPSGAAMAQDAVYTGKVGDKIKIVIQLAADTFLTKNSLLFAGKTPVYIKDITFKEFAAEEGKPAVNQYICIVNIPAILKTEGDETAGTDLKLAFKTTKNPKEAQGTVEDTSTALGAGIAVDVTRYNNQAYITKVKNNQITAGSVEVKANTADLSASAVSKAGFVAGDLGVAGAITVHLVSANNEAFIGGDIEAVTLKGGNLVVDSTIQNSNIVTNAEAAGDGADGKNLDPDSVGVGAGIAVGVTNLAVVSRILDSVTIDGSIGDLNINAGHTGTESMTASAGASGGTSAVPVLAMNISGVSVLADSGRRLGNVLNMTGNVLINAANSITRTINADAAAVGGGVGVGASFIIDILNDSAKAKLGRSVKTNGDVTVSADSVSRLKATAKSGAKGSVSKDEANADAGNSGNGSGTSGEEPPPRAELPDDYYDGLDNLFGEGSTDNELTEEDDPESLAPLFREGEADQFVDRNKQSAQDLSGLVANNNGNVNAQNVGKAFENRQKAETSEGSVQVAATMVLNIQSNTALAEIDAVDSIVADGKVSVTARHDTDGVIMANASATQSTTGVGVAVAINTVTYSNIARILTDNVTAAEVLVQASVYEAEAKKTAESFVDAIKNDVLSTKDKIVSFVNSVLEASKQGNLETFIKKYLADRALSYSKDTENGIIQLIVQWVGELLQGKTPSFPTSEQENQVKEQVTKFAKEIFEKVKKNFSVKKMKELIFGKDGLLGSLKKSTKNFSLREQAVNAAIHYLSGKLGGNEEPVGMGPRISTSAVAGAGASNVGVAGSVAISVVNGTSQAYVDQAVNGQMNVKDKITVESKASQDVYTSAGASVDALGQVEKNKNATDNANNTQGGSSNADSSKSVGVGAAVALSFADLISEAGIGSGWTIHAKDLLMDSKAENNVETTSVSGTDPLTRTEDPTDKPPEKPEDKPGDKPAGKEPTEEEKKAQEKKEAEEKAAKAMDYAVDASVSVTLIQNTVKAYLAENSVINLLGNLKMHASQSGETNTNASGFAMGNETAVGAAVAINLAFSDVLTQLLGSGTVAGSASLDSTTENQDDANALALAMGADMDRYLAKLRNSEKVMKFNKQKEEEKKDEEDKTEEDKKDEETSDGKIKQNDTADKISTQLKRASKVSDKQNEDKSDPSQPLSVQAIKSQNVKTESTNQTDAGKNGSVGSTVTDATNANTGSAVSGTLNGQAQEGQSIHVAASVGVNVTQHSAKTEIKGNLTVGGLKSQVENSGNFSTASTGAAISGAVNSNCIGAAVAVSVNGNKAIIEIPDNITITVTGEPAANTEKDADPILGNVALDTVLNQNSTGDALGRYGALAVSGSSSGKGGKVGLAGSVAVLVAKGTSAILLGNNVNINGSNKGAVSLNATDKSKLSAAAMAATKSGGAAAGVGASFALLYAENEVLAEAGDNFRVSAKDFSMTATKQAVDITDFKPDAAVSDFITILEVDEKGNGGYKTDDADKYGLIVLQKNQNGSYSLFTNLNTADILKLIQLSSVLASVNYYASAVAGTVMERTGDTSNQKAAVAGAVSMLFNNSVTRVSIGDNAKITATGEVKLDASSKTNTRLLGGALSSSAAKAGIGLNVATAKQNDRVYVTVGKAPVITAGSFIMNAESISDMLVITAAAVNASGTSVGGALNVVINNTGAQAAVGDNAGITVSDRVEINSNVKSNVTLGSVTVSISGSQDMGASVGAIVSVTTNTSAAEAIVGDNAAITSNSGSITISAVNAEQVINVLAAAARSGNGGAGAGTVSVLTTDAKALAAVGDYAKLIAKDDIVIKAYSKAKLIDVMLAAAASTDAPAVGATIMVNIFNRNTCASIGDGAVVISRLGNVLVQADSDESAIIISVAGAAASQNAVSGNIQVNVGTSKTHAIIGDNANIKAWDSIGVTADQNSTVVAISPTVSIGSGSTAVGATVQTNVLGSEVKALIGENANLIAYAQNSSTNGVQTTNRETKRKGMILSALAKDLVVAGGVSAGAGSNAAAGVVETLVNRTIVLAKLGANAVVRAGYQSGDAVDGDLADNTPSDKEGELSAEADADSTLVLFGGAFSATGSTGVGATVLTLVYDQNVDAQISLNTSVLSHVHGDVNVIAKAKNLVALVSVNFGVSNDTAANVGGNVLIFQNVVNASLTGKLVASGDVTVQAESITDLINAIASVSGSLGGAAVSGAALVTYFQGSTTASVGAESDIEAFALYVLATSTANIHSDGVGLTASVGSAAVSGLVNIIVTSTATKAFVNSGCKVKANSVSVIAADNYNLLAVAASLSGGSNGIGVTAVVTVAKNTVLAYIGDNATVECVTLTVQALSNRNIRNYAGSVAAGASAGAGVTVMVAVIGGKLDQDSANGIAKGFEPDTFMTGIQASVPNAAKDYLTKVTLSADLEADDAKASDLHVGDENGNYSGTDDYRSDDFNQQYNSGINPGENLSEGVTNTQGSNLGMAKPTGDFKNVIHAYIGSGCKITVDSATVVEANEKLNVDIITASAAVGGTTGVNVGVAVVVAYSNVLAEIKQGTELNCGDITVRAVSGGDGSIEANKASEVLDKAGIKVDPQGSSIRAIAITVGIGGTAGVSPSVAVVTMASSAIARMDAVSGSAKILTVKAETVYPNVLSVTGAIGAGGSAGIAASVAVVTFHSNTYAGITNSDLTAAELNVLTNVNNTAKAYAMSLAGGGVGVNGGVAVVTNRSTTTTELNGGRYTVSGNTNVSADVNTNAESYIVGVALGGVAVGLNAAVVNQHAKVLTQIQGAAASSLSVTGNVTVSNDITASAKASVVAITGGGVGIGGNVLLVFNNMKAKAAIINVPFNVGGNVTVSAGLKADSQAILNSATVGGIAVGISTSYVGLNGTNQAYLELPKGVAGNAASIRVYAGNAGDKNSFHAVASTVAGGAGIVNVTLNAAVADIHASNEANIFSKGTLTGSIDVQADSLAAALAEIYFASVGGVNVSAATAVAVLRISQLAKADVAAIDKFSNFNVSAVLNDGSAVTASHAKLVTVSGGLYNASANVAVAYGLSRNVAQVILGTGTNGGDITVRSDGAADAKSETLNQSVGVFNGSVYVNVAYANGQFQSVLRILDQVSANNVTVQTAYTTNANADLTPSACKVGLGSFDVNLAIARIAAKASAALEGTGKLVLARNLLVKADGSNSRALANITGASVDVTGFTFGANIADAQMALEQTVSISGVSVEADGKIDIYSNTNNLNSTAETGANGGVGITIAGGKVNSATADVSAVNQLILEKVKITAAERVTIEANSNNLAVKAIAKALDFTLSGISAAVTTTEAKVTKFNTGVFLNNANITGNQIYAIANAKGSYVAARSSVPHFSGSLVGFDSILANAKILEKLTQVMVNSRTCLTTVSDLKLQAYADALLEAGSAHHTTNTSVGAIVVNDYQFIINVEEIRTEVYFAGKMDAGYDVRLDAYDMITGNITMNDSTIGAFTGNTSVARIEVKNQTASVTAAGDITARKYIIIEAKADQKLSAYVDTSSKNFIGNGYAQTDIILYRNAFADIDGNLISHEGSINIRALLGTHNAHNKVIDLSLKMSIDTWIDNASYPTGTGRLVSVAKVNVKEGSLIHAQSAIRGNGYIDIRAKTEGYVQVYVYRYVDKAVGCNSAVAVADVNETVKVDIGGSEKTRILGYDVEIRAFSELDVRSISDVWANVVIGENDPKANVIFCVDLDTTIRSAEISAQYYMLITADLTNTYVLGHSIAKKDWASDKNSPAVIIKGNVYGDVTIDNNTILRANMLNVSAFRPAGGEALTIERLAQGYHGNKLDKTYEDIVFSTGGKANEHYRKESWDAFSKDMKFLSGVYDPSKKNENNVYYSGKLIWGAASLSGATTPSEKTEIYLGSGSAHITVHIDSQGNVTVTGHSSTVNPDELVFKQDGVYHVDGTKLLGAASGGWYSFTFDTIPNDRNYTLVDNASIADLTVLNDSQYSVQLDNVNQPPTRGDTELKVTQTNASSDLIFNGSGNFSNGSIRVDMAGGDLKLLNGAQINAQNISIRGVGTIVDTDRTDGKVVITNSSYTGNDAHSSIDIAVETELDLVLLTTNSRYTIGKIQSGSNLTVNVVNIDGKMMPVVLGELISGSNVTVNVPYSVESKDQGLINITGNSITLNAGGTVGTSYRHLCINSSVNQIGVVNVTGNGGVYLKEADGDLYIDEIRNVGNGTIAIWTQNGSIYAAPKDLTDNSTDVIEMVDKYILKYAEQGVLESDAYDMVQILLQYLADLHRIRDSLVTEGESVLESVRKEIDVLHDVISVQEALDIIDQELSFIGGEKYQDPETGKTLMDGALENEQITGAFDKEADRLKEEEDGGLLGINIVLWRDAYLKSQEYFQEAMGYLLSLLTYSVNISGNGDLHLHVQSANGSANISHAVDSLSIAIGGKVTITSAQNTVLKDVYLESYDALKLDPIVATDVIDLYSLNGIYAATKSNRVLLDADSMVLHSLINGDLGAASQALILNTNLLDALGNYVYLENRKDLVVDILIAMEDLYLTVRGNLNDLGGDDELVNGICGNGVTLKVSGDIGKKDENVTISSDKYLNITAQNLYIICDGDTRVGTIRTEGMVSINSHDGSIQNAEQGTGIWCESMKLDAYGMIGTDDNPLMIHSNGVYTSSGGGMARRLFRLRAPAPADTLETDALMANSILYGENIKIIPVVIQKDEQVEENVGVTENETTVVIGTSTETEVISSSTGIRVTGTVDMDAVLTVSDTSSHVGCPECQVLMQNRQHEDRIYVNLEIVGEYTGELCVQIPATGNLAKYEGQEVVILACRGGTVWAIRGKVINGFVVFYSEELGSFLILGDPSDLELSEDGTQLILDQQILSFGGWM